MKKIKSSGFLGKRAWIKRSCLVGFVQIFRVFLALSFFTYVPSACPDGGMDVTWEDERQVFDDDDCVRGLIVLKGGFSIDTSVNTSAEIYMDIVEPVFGPINLGGTGKLTLCGDLLLGSHAAVTNGGKINGNGFSLILTTSLVVPESKIKIIGDTIIDGRGNDLCLRLGKLVIEEDTTLTLKNVNVCGLAGTEDNAKIELEGTSSKLVLQNACVYLDDDFDFQNGALFVHGDVSVAGKHDFVYKSSETCTIGSCSFLSFERDSRLSYQPGSSERTLVRMMDDTSYLCFNNAALEAPVSGMQFLGGNLMFDNRVALDNPTVAGGVTQNTNKVQGITIGDGTNQDNDVAVYLLSGANVEITGVLDYNNVT